MQGTQVWSLVQENPTGHGAIKPMYHNYKASEGDGIPVVQILKDDAVKVLHSIGQQIGKTQQWPQDWKRSVFFPIPKKGNAKECSNYHTIALISHASKVMLKILQARLQQYVNCKLPDIFTSNFQHFKLDLEKEKNQRSNCQHLLGHQSKESSRKTSISALLTMPKTLTVWITTNCGKFSKRWKYQTILPASWEICMQVKKQQLELDMEQQIGSTLGKEYVKAVYCLLSY